MTRQKMYCTNNDLHGNFPYKPKIAYGAPPPRNAREVNGNTWAIFI